MVSLKHTLREGNMCADWLAEFEAKGNDDLITLPEILVVSYSLISWE